MSVSISGEFTINDQLLNIPPEQIHIERRSVNHMWQTLRTRSSIKVKSGFSMIDISLNVKFTDSMGIKGVNGYDQLQRLVAELRVSPFCYVQNQFIRDAILGSDNQQTMALVLKHMSITKRADDTNVVEVSLGFSWFNYFPYSRNFSFRNDILDPREVSSPAESKAYKRMISAEFRRGQYRSLKDTNLGGGGEAKTSAIFKQFAQLTPGNYNKLLAEQKLLEEYKQLRAVDDYHYENHFNKFLSKTLNPLREAGLKTTTTAFEEQYEKIGEDIQDIGTSMFNTEKFTGAQEIEILESVAFSDLQARRYGLPEGGTVTPWEPVKNIKGEIIKYKEDPILKKGPGQGDTSKDSVLLERSVRFNFNEKGLIVTGISVGFENVLAVMPLIGHPYPSYQHIGSMDAVVTLSIMTTSNTAIQALSGFYSIIENQAFKYRMAPQGQRNILIVDPIINACGLSEFIPENLVVDTVPGQPGTYSATLNLVDSPTLAGQREEIIPAGSFSTTQSIRKSISDILLKDLKVKVVYLYGLTKGSYVWGGTGKKRGNRFNELCIKYISGLNDTLKELREIEMFKNKSESIIFRNISEYTLEPRPDYWKLDYEIEARAVIPGWTPEGDRRISGLPPGSQPGRSRDMQFRRDFWGDVHWDREEVKKIREKIPSGFDILESVAANTAAYFYSKTLRVDRILRKWEAFFQEYIDKILNSDHIEMDQFKSVREEMAKGILGSSGDCYPDFPLKEVIAELEDHSPEQYEALEELALELQLLQKKYPVSCLIGPDFYFYNHTDALPRIIPPEVMGAAKTAVLEAQEQMHESEKTWVEGGYKQKYLGEKLAKKIKDSITDTTGDEEYFTKAKEGSLQAKVAAAMKRMLEGSDGVFYPDDLPAEGSLHSSIAAAKEAGNPITVRKISDDDDPHNAIGARREGMNMEPQDHYKDLEHRFGSDAIGLASSVLWGWPVSKDRSHCHNSDNFGARRAVTNYKNPHKGIDISSGESWDASLKLDILASASGEIVDVRPNLKELQKEKEGYYKHFKVKPPGETEARPKEKEHTTSIKIRHENGWHTVYKHMQWEGKFMELWNAMHVTRDKSALRIEKRDRLGKMGTVGYSTDPHLHFEIRTGSAEETVVNPTLCLDGVYDKHQGPGSVFDTSGDSLLNTCVCQLEKDLVDGQAYSMIRAYPTFRLYFIESDMGERKRFAFDDFFSYSSVKEIQVIRNRKIAADLCLLSITNVSGALSNRKFKDKEELEEDPHKRRATNTAEENRLQQLMLQPGIQIQLRLGYSNNPDDLEKVFNGIITDVQFNETDDMVNVTCQSFAVQLTQMMKGEKKKKFGGFFSSTGRTGAILEELLASPEVTHFGRWEPSTPKPEAAGGSAPAFSTILSNRWEFTPKPYDDNIFAPTGKGWRAIWDSTPEYTADETTIWDVFQEMTLRHPGFVACAVPYDGKFGPRMTMFFGCPEQLYNARDSTFKEDGMLDGLKRFIQAAQREADKHKDSTSEDLQDSDTNCQGKQAKAVAKARRATKEEIPAEVTDFWLNKMAKSYALDKGIVRAFRSYHVLTSTLHILYNNITSSSYECFNAATIHYREKFNFFTGVATLFLASSPNSYETFTLKCDGALPDEDTREVFVQYDNCLGFEMAKRYALGTLFHVMKEGYKGSIVTIGNPTIKPYDICYIFDEYTDMFGPIEVEQVVHRFSQETGFITEITPDMLVHVNRLSTLSTADALGYAAETALKKIGIQSLPSVNAASSKAAKAGATVVQGGAAMANAANTIMEYGFAPIANMFFNSTENAVRSDSTTNPFALLGIFIFRKLLTRSQLAHPFRYSPLVKNGKPMLGGLPSKKIDGSFITGVKKWFKEAAEGTPLFLEDAYDRMSLSTWWSPTWGDMGARWSGEE